MTRPETNFLNEEYTIDTPENVSFGYEVAGIGSRFIGVLIDSALIVVALLILNFVLFVIGALLGGTENMLDVGSGQESLDWAFGLLLALYAVLNFVIFWGYYIFFEFLWNGQTPGKRVAQTRVVRMDGQPIGVLENVVRNLVRIIDFLPTAYLVGLVTMFCNRHARRLGDFAAGTLVVKDQPALQPEQILAELSTVTVPDSRTPADEGNGVNQPPAPGPVRLQAADRELIRETLSRHRAGIVERDLVARLARVMAAKVDVPAPVANDPVAFLEDLLNVDA